MNLPGNSSRNDQPESASEEDAGWRKAFEQTIKSYAEAESSGRHDEAQAVALQALMMAAEEAERNPTPDLLLIADAERCEVAGDWAGAEAARRKVLALRESELAQADARSERAGDSTAAQPDDERWRAFGLIAKAHADLSALQKRWGRLDDAWNSARAATAAARRANLWPLLHLTLQNETACALDRGDVASALAAASEDVRQIEPGALHDSMRARALLARGRCLVASGDLAAAEQDLAASWELLEPRSHSAFLAGVQRTIARWWETTARLRARKGDGSGAVAAWRQAVEKRREVAALPQVETPSSLDALASALKEFSEALSQAGDLDAAGAALAEAETIRGNAGLPPKSAV